MTEKKILNVVTQMFNYNSNNYRKGKKFFGWYWKIIYFPDEDKFEFYHYASQNSFSASDVKGILVWHTTDKYWSKQEVKEFILKNINRITY